MSPSFWKVRVIWKLRDVSITDSSEIAGGVAASRLARSRSTKHTSISGVSEQELDEFIRQGLIDEDFASILEQFMKGKLCTSIAHQFHLSPCHFDTHTTSHPHSC